MNGFYGIHVLSIFRNLRFLCLQGILFFFVKPRMFFSRLLCNVRELPWYINHTRKFKNNVKHQEYREIQFRSIISLTIMFISFYFFIIYSCFGTIHDICINLSPNLQFTTLYTMKVYPITKSNNRKIHQLLLLMILIRDYR